MTGKLDFAVFDAEPLRVTADGALRLDGDRLPVGLQIDPQLLDSVQRTEEVQILQPVRVRQLARVAARGGDRLSGRRESRDLRGSLQV